jgi:hypothetical protein
MKALPADRAEDDCQCSIGPPRPQRRPINASPSPRGIARHRRINWLTPLSPCGGMGAGDPAPGVLGRCGGERPRPKVRAKCEQRHKANPHDPLYTCTTPAPPRPRGFQQADMKDLYAPPTGAGPSGACRQVRVRSIRGPNSHLTARTVISYTDTHTPHTHTPLCHTPP